MNPKMVVATIVLTLGSAAPVLAEDFEVQMLNRNADGQVMVFEPAFLHIQPGDTVTFVPTDPSHNAETIVGMLPEGAEPFRGRINEEISVTFEQEGLYGYRCTPHFAMGMVGLIKVGDAAENAEAVQSVNLPPKAKERMIPLIEEALSDDASGAEAGNS